MSANCERCRYSQKIDGKMGEKHVRCHKNAPVIDMETGYGRFPIIEKKSWCGAGTES